MKALIHKLADSKWRAILTLGFIYLSIFTYWWLWGLLLIIWGVVDLRTGETWLSEPVVRSENPILFHLIVMTWLVFGFYIITIPMLNLLG